MMSSRPQQWIAAMSPEERIACAEDRLPDIIDRIREVVHLHESNQIVAYSDSLSSQIPKSYAGNAFQIFTATMLQSEIARLLTVWDAPSEHRKSLPTIAALVDDADVQEALKSKTLRNRRTRPPAVPNGNDKETFEWFEKIEDQRAEEAAAQNIARLSQGIVDVHKMHQSDAFKAAKDFRNVHLAHLLAHDAKQNPHLPVKYGDERKLLEQTIPIVEAFNIGVRDSNFLWDEQFGQAKKCAEALWKGCSFKVLE